MEEFDADEMLNPQKEPRRKVRLVKNGDPSQMRTCLIKDHINFEGLSEVICESIGASRRDSPLIRVFKTGGVEVFDEDVQYIKEGDILFISFGDEFDESSNFAVYKLLNCLGQGGYGKVFEARNRLSKERYAIKMIDCSKIKNAKDTEMIYKELIALKNLSHRSILKVYNCFTLQKEMKVALVLEYLEGGDLRDYLNEKKVLGEKEAQKLFTQLFHAIQYCHKESIIHRDLKLENIMFDDKEHERLKVVDFGISGRQSLVNIDYTEAGSIRYLAPEVITSHAPAHPSIDVWAMGCILFWMLTGNSPFPQSTREGVQESIVKGKWSFSPEDRKKLSKASQDLIKSILVVNIKDRATMSDIAEHRWMNLLYDEIVLEEEREREQQAQTKQKKMSSIGSADYSIEVSPASAPVKQKTLPSNLGSSHLHKVSSPVISQQMKNSSNPPQRKPQIPTFESLNSSNHTHSGSSGQTMGSCNRNITKPSTFTSSNDNRLSIPKKGDPHRRFSYQAMQSALFGSTLNDPNLAQNPPQEKKLGTQKAQTIISRSKSPGTMARQRLSTLNPPQYSNHLHTHSGERAPSSKPTHEQKKKNSDEFK